jgi:PilZ domain
MSPESSESKSAVQESAASPPPSGAAAVVRPGEEVRRERRAFRRRPVRAKVRIQTDPLGMAPFFDVSASNFSEGGICFVTSKELTPGTRITVDIQRASTGKQLKSEADIRWTKAVAEKQFHVGCQWKRRLNFTELQHFM